MFSFRIPIGATNGQQRVESVASEQRCFGDSVGIPWKLSDEDAGRHLEKTVEKKDDNTWSSVKT